jgi:hypothetical protein
MVHRPLVGVLILVAPALAACHTAKPAPQRPDRVVVRSPDPPEKLLAKIRADAKAQGRAILDDGPEGMVVDLGVREARIAVPTDYGLWGTRVQYRDTQVRDTAFYEVRGDSGGSVLTVSSSPAYLHPETGCWLPGPWDPASTLPRP